MYRQSGNYAGGVGALGSIIFGRFFEAVLLISAGCPLLTGQTQKLGLIEAVSATLKNHPQLASQQAQIEITRGAKAIASGIFDPVLQTGLQANLTNEAAEATGADGLLTLLPSTETINQTEFSAGGTKLFRSGVTISPSYQLTRTTDSFLYPGGLNSSVVGVTVNVPLLRGRGEKVVAAQERAADMEIRASQYDFDFLLASLANAAAQDYWALVAAYRNVDIALSAEGRGRLYVENTQALIDADHVPRSDINQVRANLAQREAARIAAQNALVIARQSLAQAMGNSPEEILRPLGEPEDDFPRVPESLELPDETALLQQRLNRALGQRPDYLAASIRRREAETLLPQAQNRLLPALGLSFGGGYQGIRPGTSPGDLLASPFAGVRGPNVAGGLTYSYPVGNQAASGALQQTRASIRQAGVVMMETAREISKEITVAVDGVRSSVLHVGKAVETVRFAEASLSGARDKYRAGIGSVVEILQVEDQLNAALADEVVARLDFALALTQYRFALGTLVPSNQQTPVIRREAFMELGPDAVTGDSGK